MIKYIFNTNGEYVAYIFDDKYCFSTSNEYIGFMNGVDLYDYNGNYLGTLTSDDRFIRQKGINKPKIIGITKPVKPLLPLKPMKRFKMTRLNNYYIDIFSDVSDNSYFYKKLDYKYNKYLDCKLYAADNHFLGVLSLNKYDRDSLANSYGTYGNQYNLDSIFNKYGNYGSEYNIYSPFNKYSILPAYLEDKNGNIVANVSDNMNLSGNVINATELINWFKEKINF